MIRDTLPGKPRWIDGLNCAARSVCLAHGARHARSVSLYTLPDYRKDPRDRCKSSRCIIIKSEFHFLLPSYTFVILITLSNENLSRLPLLKALNPLFFICVYWASCKVMIEVLKYQNNDKKWNKWIWEVWTKIINGELRSLHILSRNIDVTCRSYLTKTSKKTKLG
jgi:hypothetical protein